MKIRNNCDGLVTSCFKIVSWPIMNPNVKSRLFTKDLWLEWSKYERKTIFYVFQNLIIVIMFLFDKKNSCPSACCITVKKFH